MPGRISHTRNSPNFAVSLNALRAGSGCGVTTESTRLCHLDRHLCALPPKHTGQSPSYQSAPRTSRAQGRSGAFTTHYRFHSSQPPRASRVLSAGRNPAPGLRPPCLWRRPWVTRRAPHRPRRGNGSRIESSSGHSTGVELQRLFTRQHRPQSLAPGWGGSRNAARRQRGSPRSPRLRSSVSRASLPSAAR